MTLDAHIVRALGTLRARRRARTPSRARSWRCSGRTAPARARPVPLPGRAAVPSTPGASTSTAHASTTPPPTRSCRPSSDRSRWCSRTTCCSRTSPRSRTSPSGCAPGACPKAEARAAGRRAGSSASAWPTTPATAPGRSRAARRSGSRWPGRWPPSPGCSCSTSRSPPSTPAPAATSGATCAATSATFDGVRLLVTHDPVDAYALADRVVILEAGRVVADRAPSPTSPPRPRSRYIADLIGVNLFSGVGRRRHDHHRGRRADRRPPIPSTAPPSPSSSRTPSPSTRRCPTAAPATSGASRCPTSTARPTVSACGSTASVPLVAEITPAALDALALRPGDPVWASVKATEIATYPA